jgi:uncharacterized protein involved in response to NO
VTRTPSRLTPSSLFFPAAALYAALALPVSVLGMTGSVAVPRTLVVPAGHAHAMLLGFGLAVIAGYQLPRVPRARLLLLLAAWLAARAAQLVPPLANAGYVLDAGFALAVALHIAPRLARAAKKWRNQALPALLAAACAAGFAYALAALLAAPAPARDALLTAMVMALAGLMLFMGGRILAPAIAGEFYRQGDSLAARVQPRIEASLIAASAVAIVAALLGPDLLLRAACGAAAVLAPVRLLRWQPWRCARRHDLLRLCAGYAWLALGLAGVAGTAPGGVRIAALHLITVGALGTHTLNVMANVTAARSRALPRRDDVLDAGTLLVAAAAALRLAAAFAPARAALLLDLAAGCWSAAFAALAWLLWRSRRAAQRSAPAHP